MYLPVYANVGSFSNRGVRASGIAPSSTCISATIEGGQACIDIPVIGKKCISVPSWVPSGSVASLCADICKTWGIPTGACLTATVAGQQVAHQCFGKC